MIQIKEERLKSIESNALDEFFSLPNEKSQTENTVETKTNLEFNSKLKSQNIESESY
ncbi:MAG: hypothetical protein MHPSP_000590, partial [Paramarteilia canceri]